MEMKKRPLTLQIVDHHDRIICPLYDGSMDISGQAFDVYISTERNGWKELQFSLPTTCQTQNDIEQNYRLQYLKADWKIRATEPSQDDPSKPVQDWFIISEPKVIHKAFSKNIQVTAGHISQLLKYKNLNLQFTDKYGNNVGTAEQLLTTILTGTGWTVGQVYPFKEKDGKIKIRTLSASTRTGAFKLITKMCELFDAKPIFNGDRSVDILPINPFSQPKDGKPPQLDAKNRALELFYGRNVKQLTRTLKTDNMVTRLFAYGSYGDSTTGYCGIDECTHKEYNIVLNDDLTKDEVYYFRYIYGDEQNIVNFSPKDDMSAGDVLIFSLYDPASMMYVWNEKLQKAYRTNKGINGTQLVLSINSIANKSEDKVYATYTTSELTNWFSSVMDFDYYNENNVITDEMVQAIANYQRLSTDDYKEVNEASAEFAQALTNLSRIVGSIKFCKLKIASVDEQYPYFTLRLDKTDEYPDGVIYRSDFYAAKKDQFKFIPASRDTQADGNMFDTHGDPINPATSVVYILHQPDPLKINRITWDKLYVRDTDDKDNPNILTLNASRDNVSFNKDTDKVFIFEYNGINGYLGSYEAIDESTEQALYNLTTIGTVQHPVVFRHKLDGMPDIPLQAANEYCWAWVFSDDYDAKSEFYFCYGKQGETQWRKVHYKDSQPVGASYGQYWYNWLTGQLFRYNGSSWAFLQQDEEKSVASYFSGVYSLCLTRDRLYKGVYDNYIHNVQSGELSKHHYYIDIGFGSYWAFTIDDVLNNGDSLSYGTKDGWVTQRKLDSKTGQYVQSTVKSKTYAYSGVYYHPSNIWGTNLIEAGGFNSSGAPVTNTKECRTTKFMSVYPNTAYVVSGIPSNGTVYLYDESKTFIKAIQLGLSNIFTTTPDILSKPVGYVKLGWNITKVSFDSGNYAPDIHANDAANTIVINDVTYYPLNVCGQNKETDVQKPLKGIIPQIELFYDACDYAYITCYDALVSRQQDITDRQVEMKDVLKDLYKQGYWQKDDYVDGDEEKLYDDAIDNIKKISIPQATYNISYLDLFGSSIGDDNYGASEQTLDVEWPNINITTAIHLVDPQINVNTWAYVDKLKKCYDQPKKTTISINTNLTVMTQHTFSDVLSNIAQVASSAKGKAAAAMGNSPTISGSNIANGSISGINIENGSISIDKLANIDTYINQIIDDRFRNLRIGAAQIEKAAINIAKINDATINTLSAHAAEIAKADIGTAVIDQAQIKQAVIDTLFVDKEYIDQSFIRELNADNITVTGKFKGQNIDATTINVSDLTAGTINGFLIPPGVISVQKLANDALANFTVNYLDHIPTTSNEPFVTWQRTKQLEVHLGDMVHYKDANGINRIYRLRYRKDENGQAIKNNDGQLIYYWQEQLVENADGTMVPDPVGDLVEQIKNGQGQRIASYINSDDGVKSIVTDGNFGTQMKQDASNFIIQAMQDEAADGSTSHAYGDAMLASISVAPSDVKISGKNIYLDGATFANTLNAAQLTSTLLTSERGEFGTITTNGIVVGEGGVNAQSIQAGSIYGSHIEGAEIQSPHIAAGSITVNDLHSSVGSSLNLSSNVSVNMVAKNIMYGRTGFALIIDAPNGTTLSQQTQSVTLTASLNYDMVPLTEQQYDAYVFTWKARGKQDWQQEGRSITIRKGDIETYEEFYCQVQVNIGTEQEKTMHTLSKGIIVSTTDGSIIASTEAPPTQSSQPFDKLWLNTSATPATLNRWVPQHVDVVDGEVIHVPASWQTILVNNEYLAQLDRRISEAQLQVDSLTGISGFVKKDEYDAGIKAVREQMGSLMFDENSFKLAFEKTSLSSDMANLNDDISKLSEFRDTVSDYLEFQDGVLTLGRTDNVGSDFKTEISTTQMAFKQGENVVSYISDKSMYITQARVTDTLSIGTPQNGYFDWVTISGDKGGLGLKWRNT